MRSFHTATLPVRLAEADMACSPTGKLFDVLQYSRGFSFGTVSRDTAGSNPPRSASQSPQNARLSPDAVRITTASARGPQIRLQPIRAGRARDSRKLTSELTWLRNRSQCDVASRAAARPG